MVQRTSRVSIPRMNARTRTHADASTADTRQYASLIIPVIIINCSDADEIGIDLRSVQ